MSVTAHKGPVKAAPAPKPAAKHSHARAPGALLQRKCACGGKSQGSCSGCNDEKVLQRRAAHQHAGPASIPSSVHSVLQSPGRPLDSATRGFMEPRFGHDFGHVRVHSGAQAAQSARDMDARAYTVGNHIVFDQGEYAPHSHAGRQLLAHELAHTVQQHGMQRSGRHLELGDSPAYSHLEREADSLADRVMRTPAPVSPAAAPPLPVTHRPLRPVVSRAARGGPPKRKWEPADPAVQAAVAGAGLANPVQVLQQAQFDKNTYIFEIDKFYLPSLKGPVRKEWEATANKNRLETFVEFSGSDASIALWQSRNPTAKLRATWFRRVGWTRQNAAQRWCESGGPPPGANRLPGGGPVVVNGATTVECQFDHIVELQFGGTNNESNVQVLDQPANNAAGGLIWNQVKSLSEAIRNAMPAPPRTIGLHFNSVEVSGTEVTCGSAFAAGTAPSCSDVECAALSKQRTPNPICGAAPAGAAATAAPAQPPNTDPYPIRVGNNHAVIYAPIGSQTVDLWTTGPANKVAAEIIPGLLLLVLHRGTTEVEEGEKGKRAAYSTDTIEACMEGVNCAVQRSASVAPTRIPEAFRGLGIVYLRVEPPTGGREKPRRLKLDSKSRKLSFLHPHLSPINLDLNVDDDMGFTAKGKLVADLPILRGLPIIITIEEGQIYASADVPKDKLKLPFPGVRITRLRFGISLVPDFDPQGWLDFEVGPAGKPAFTGSVVVGKDDNGLRLEGLIQAHLPGVSKAEGKLEYSNKLWSGSIDIGVDNFKLPGLQSANVHVGFAEGKFEVTGGVSLQLPGGQTAEMLVRRESGRWVYKGSGTFKIPRLDPIKISVTYDGKAISGSAETGFTYQKLKGKIKVFYESKPGAERARIWGEGSLEFTKGRAKGKLTVKMSERGRFSGDGSFEFEIKKGLIAKGRVVMDEEEKVTVEGSLKLPTYRLFEDSGERTGRQPKPLIEVGPLSIPTPLSLGGKVGLVVRVHGGIYLSYGFGPVDIKNGYISTKLNPLEEDTDFSVEVGGTVVAKAFLTVTGVICGELVLDLLVAEAGGGLGAALSATLWAKGEADFKAGYSKDEVSAAITRLSLEAGLDLRLKILAYVWASVGVWRLKWTTGKTWDLATFNFPVGKLGMNINKPLGYSTKSGFMMPSFDDINWVKPTFDVEKAVNDGFGGGDEGVEEKGKKSVNPCKDV